MNKLFAVLAAVVLGVAGCGGPDEPQSAASSAASLDGCTVAETEELYVTEMYRCEARSTRVYLFNTSTARDSYRKVAEEFGAVVAGQGDTWLEVKAD